MHVRFHVVCVKNPRLPIVHVTVKVMTTCFARNPHLLILKRGQVTCHFPHLPHVLVVDQLVDLWDKLRGEEGAVLQCGFLNNTTFGPDVVLTTLCCHEDGLATLRIIKEAHRKSSRHNNFGPLHVHLLSFPDRLEWTCDPIVRRVSLFPNFPTSMGSSDCPLSNDL
jgi:hypothetical protein